MFYSRKKEEVKRASQKEGTVSFYIEEQVEEALEEEENKKTNLFQFFN